jgi:hypothetical protein
MKNIFSKCAVGVGIAAMIAASSLNATTFYSDKVSIPFEFSVAKVTLPAGEYRIQQSFASDIAYVVNVKTGQQVQVLRSTGNHVEGRARLIFENTNGSYKLKGVS